MQLDTSSLGFALKVSKKKSYLLEASRQILWKYSPSVITLYTDNSVCVCLKHSKKTSPKSSFSAHHPCAPAAFFQETDKWCATPICWQGFLPPLPMCLLLLPIPPPKPDPPAELWAVTAAIAAEHWWGCMGEKHRRRSLAETLNTYTFSHKNKKEKKSENIHKALVPYGEHYFETKWILKLCVQF